MGDYIDDLNEYSGSNSEWSTLVKTIAVIDHGEVCMCGKCVLWNFSSTVIDINNQWSIHKTICDERFFHSHANNSYYHDNW